MDAAEAYEKLLERIRSGEAVDPAAVRHVGIDLLGKSEADVTRDLTAARERAETRRMVRGFLSKKW